MLIQWLMPIIVLLIAVMACAAHADDAEVKIEGPTLDAAKGVQVFHITSPYLGKTSTIEVLLPDNLAPDEKLRTLYALPVEGGIGGEFGDSIDELKKIDAANKYRLVCVTMSFDSVPWYGSHATDPHKRHDLFIKRVVVPLIEKQFPVTGKPADRLLIGFSKSGWGAVSLLLRNPDFFGAACSWDAPLMMTEAKLGWGSKNHFGTPEHAAAYVPLHLIEQPGMAEQLAKQPPRLTILGHDLYGKDTQAFDQRLTELHIPHRFDNDLQFKHRWDSGWLEPALKIFLAPNP